MLRFRGFRASLNFTSEKGINTDHQETFPGVSLIGAYKSSNEFVANGDYSNPQKRIRPSMVKLPNSQSTPKVTPSKSTSNLVRPRPETTNISNSSPDIPQTNNSNVNLTKSQVKEQNNLEKRRLSEQKKRDKLAAQEQKKRDKLAAQEQKKREKIAAQEQQKRDKLAAQEQQKRDKLAAKEQQKQEKLRKETERRAHKTRTGQDKNKGPNRSAPQPPPLPPNPSVPSNSQTQKPLGYSTNTLESSISKSSGPPPYNSIPEVIPNESDDTGNTSFAKPEEDSGSWEMISQHRQQLQRPAAVSKSATKQRHLNLNYNVAASNVRQENSEA